MESPHSGGRSADVLAFSLVLRSGSRARLKGEEPNERSRVTIARFEIRLAIASHEYEGYR
jgi:hypothetical protein